MKIIYEINPTAWNSFIADNSSPASFLQSWQWGEFQKSLGLKVYRFAVIGDSGELQAVAQAIVRPLYFGKTYLEVAKGPVWKLEIGSWKLVVEELQRIGKRENSILVRINPPYESFQPPTSDLQHPEILLRQTEPADTILVNLSHSEEELLAQMHEKSRYNIRLAMKKGVKVEEKTRDREAFDKFLELIRETSKRDGITVWPRERFEKFRQMFLHNTTLVPGGRGIQGEGETPRAILLTGEYQGKSLAAAIIMLFGDSGTYLYAASSAEERSANVPSLVLWEAIRTAKAAGKKHYDMWGIAPAGTDESHSWAGITRFKSRYVKIGETGLERHYVGTRDLILDKKYYSLFKLAKTLRTLTKT